MSTRRPHRKSRAGCLNCKKRHMKCGEERPGCQNCFEYNDIQCQYPPGPNTGSPRHRLGSLGNDPPSSAPQAPAIANTIYNNINHSLDDDLNVADLELLHQFTTSTYKTMSNVPDEQFLWQTRIIAIGLQHTFLLRGILALSAAHLAYLEPPRLALSYLVKASAHQNKAISQFRHFIASVTPSTFDAVLAFSYLVPVHSIAMAACSNVRQRMQAQDYEDPAATGLRLNFEREDDNLSAALKAVSLIRSINKLLLPALDNSPTITTTLHPLLEFTRQADTLPEADIFRGQEALDLLESACVAFATSTAAQQQYEHVRIQEFSDAIAQLRKTFARVAYPYGVDEKFIIGVVLLWTFDVTEEYVVLLQEHHPCALAIWAYFSTLLHGRDLWWLEGLGTSMVNIVSQKLGKEWWSVMEFPRQAVGLD